MVSGDGTVKVFQLGATPEGHD